MIQTDIDVLQGLLNVEDFAASFEPDIQVPRKKEIVSTSDVLSLKFLVSVIIISFQYHLDLTAGASEHAGPDLKKAVEILDKNAKDAKMKAQDYSNTIEKLLQEYKGQLNIYQKEMSNTQKDIRSKEQNIDNAIFDISEDCITKCKTSE